MAWRKRYAMSRQYDETVAFAEERSFLEGYKNPLIQLDCMDVMLVISHSDNTFDKTQLRNKNSLTPDGKQLMKKTDLTLNHFIKDNDLRKFFLEV
jgi:hypothetical protein